MGRRRRPANLGRIVAPLLAPQTVDRPRISTALEGADQRRITLLAAGPGFGKTSALALWAADRHCAWYRVTPTDRDPLTLARGVAASLSLRVPGLLDSLAASLDGGRGPDHRDDRFIGAFVADLADLLDGGSGTDVLLVLDDLHELTGSPAVGLVAELCRAAPRRLHLVIASRAELPFPADGLRVQGHLRVMGVDALAFDDAETADLLAAVGDAEMRAYATEVRRLTGGWPAAVRLAAECLAAAADRDQTMAGLASRYGAVDLVEDLLETGTRDDPGLLALLRVGLAVDEFDADLLAALGLPDAAGLLEAARRQGIHLAPASADGWYTLTPLAMAYARARLADSVDDRAEIRTSAGRWHARRGDRIGALTYLRLAGDASGLAGLLHSDGMTLLAEGNPDAVAAALTGIPAELRTPCWIW